MKYCTYGQADPTSYGNPHDIYNAVTIFFPVGHGKRFIDWKTWPFSSVDLTRVKYFGLM